MNVEMYFDGACDNNSKLKLMGIGVAVLIDSEYSDKYSHASMLGGNGTNNVAEWGAFTKALEIAKDLHAELPPHTFRIYGDSQVVIKQFNNEWATNAFHLREMYNEAKEYITDNPRVFEDSFKGVYWLRRTNNIAADILSKKGITDWLVDNNLV
jgi:ribonuclease HI